MSQRVLALGAVVVLFFASTTFGQDKKESPASPSDISVDQIKKATAKPDAKATAKQEPDAKATDDKSAAKDDTPKPVAEGTAVAQPDCGTSKCNSCCDPCKPCRKRCRGRMMSRLRSMFSRKCCCG